MTRILIVNPNTTQAVTDVVLAEAQRTASAGVHIEAVTSDVGASIVSTEPENVIASRAMLELLAAHHAGFDAAIAAISFDSGVFAARTLLPIPVVGITEAALHTACLIGRRYGLVVLGKMSIPLYDDLIDRIGLRSRLGAIEAVEVASRSQYLDRALMDRAILEAVERLAARGGIDVAVICGAAVAGVAHRLSSHASLPLLDGVAPALAQAQALARLAVKPPAPPRRLASDAPPKGIGSALGLLLHNPS